MLPPDPRRTEAVRGERRDPGGRWTAGANAGATAGATAGANATVSGQAPGSPAAPRAYPVPVTPAGSMAIDLHLHTTASPCGYQTPAQVVAHARAAGRLTIAITDHNTAQGAMAARDLVARTGGDITVLVGMELSTSDFGHVVVFGKGIEDDWGWRSGMPMPRDLPDDWVAIQAHPFRHVGSRSGPLVVSFPDLPPSISAIERWNGNDVLHKFPHRRDELDTASMDYIKAQSARTGRRITPVASSDAHRSSSVHAFHTLFPRPVRTVADLAEQIRSGEAVPGRLPEPDLAAIRDAHARREVIGAYLKGSDWAHKAHRDGQDPATSAHTIRMFGVARHIIRRGGTQSDIVAATGMPDAHARDYAAIVHEEGHSPDIAH